MAHDSCKAHAPASEPSLRDLLVHAWDRSRFYHEVYSAHGIGRRDLYRIALEDLPVVSKADLMVRFDEAVTDPRLRKSDLEQWLRNDVDPLNLYLDDYIIVHGSGGTKIYSYVPYTREAWNQAMTAAAPLLLPLDRSTPKPLRSAFYFWTAGHYVGATSARFASSSAHEVLSLSVFDPAEEVCARLNAFRPERLTSYASGLSWLAEWALQGKLRVAPRSVLSSGDRLTPAIRAQVKAAWNADVYDLYGACESICMAVQCPGEDEYAVLTASNVVEVVDSANRMVQPGTRGRVLMTSLVNYTLPMIRFDLHDFAILGRARMGAESLRRLEGKTHHALPIRLADGSTSAIEVYELAQLEIPAIEKIQFVAHSPFHVEIRYQSAHELDSWIDAAFRRLLTQKSAMVDRITIKRVDRIANSLPAFKLECVVGPEQRTFAPASLDHDGRGSVQQPIARMELAVPCYEAHSDESIGHRLSYVARERSMEPAALDGNRSLTYGRLDQLAAQVAGELLRRGFDASRPVAVLCGHRFEVLPLLIGIIRAGGFYLPLDPYLQPARLQSIIAAMGANLVLTTVEERHRARALASHSASVICLEEIEVLPGRQCPARPPADLACVLFTSGSTGEPKGVALTNATIRERSGRYATDYGLGPTDRVALLQSYAVSAGVREIFGALLAGATLAFYDVRRSGLAAMASWLNAHRISVLYAVPTLFRAFIETLTAETFPTVRVLRLGGEPVQPEDLTGFRRHFASDCLLANGYAATETDTICQYVMDRDTPIVAGRIPVGVAVRGVDVTLCDEQGIPVTDALGEVRVTSPMIASGYWDPRSGKAQPFDRPFATGDLGYRLPDGRVFLVGRRDLVVKVHGKRIDLREIDRAVAAVPGVAEAVAVHQPMSRDTARIVVYYVPRVAEPASAAALRQAVSSVVPERVVSSRFVRVPTLPRLPGGKVNRANLMAQCGVAVERPGEHPSYATETETALACIWREVLKVASVARSAHFFDLGGDSIAVFHALSRIAKTFGVDLPIEEFFAHLELSDLARIIDRRRSRLVQRALHKR